MKPTVAIIYGFGEGPKHAKQLSAALQKRKFTVIDSPARADIIITHSGGCLLLPKNTKGKIIIMMSPSCSPLIKVPFVFAKKMLIEFEQSIKNRYAGAWFNKALLNAWYVWARLPYNLRMVARICKTPERLPSVAAARVWVINSRYDPWALLLERSEAERLPHYTFLSHAGSHDGLWLRPELCANIVQSAYGT